MAASHNKALTVGTLPVADNEDAIRKLAEALTYSTANRFAFEPKADWFVELEQELVDAIGDAVKQVRVELPVRYNVKRRAA
jgi:argininosuccinate lyase